MVRKSEERGQSLVEVGISFILILFLLSGAVDLGRAFLAFIALQDASQEGAIYAAIADKDSAGYNAVVQRVRQSSGSPVNLADTGTVSVAVSPSGAGYNALCAGQTVQVSITHQFAPVTPLSNLIFSSGTVPITASTAATVLTPACP